MTYMRNYMRYYMARYIATFSLSYVMAKKLSLSRDILGELAGVNDADWRRSHNVGRKRPSRKETRKELRKKRKQHDVTELTQESRVEKKKKEPKELKKKKEKKKSDVTLAPFLSAHELDMQKQDDDNIKYYSKMLGLKSGKDDDLFADLDLDLDLDGHSSDGPTDDELKGNSEKGRDEDGSSAEENQGLRIVKEDELGLDDDSLSEDDFLNEEEGLRVVKEDELGADDDSLSEGDFLSGEDDEDEDDDENDAAKTMAKLKALKKGKTSEIRIVKEDELGLDDDSLSEDDFLSGDDDEDDAAKTMAKLKALKKGKTSEIRVVKEDELGLDDDSLSEGDFLSENEEEDADDADDAEKTPKKSLKQGKTRVVKEDELGLDDDSLSDFDEDSFDEDEDDGEMTAAETMAKLKALKSRKAEPESESESEEENPYIPPKRRQSEATKKEIVVDTAALEKLRKSFKSQLNRLAEPTLAAITNSTSAIFMQNSISDSTTAFTDELLSIVDTDQPVQHSLITVYTALVTALYDRVGVNFAAQFLQTLVERVYNSTDVKQNLVMLITEMYSFNIVSSNLPYEMIEKCLELLNETQIERILTILRSGGSQLRSDDPVALKRVILLLQQEIGKTEMTPRMRFLVDAAVALKNNRQKPLSQTIIELRSRLRKQLKLSKQPLRVGLQDILNSNERGKWWLVGASWKGNDEKKPEIEFADDDFGAVNWLDLAKKQRLNTDVRRAVFVALMGAEDYLEACIRIDKLGLKNRQERDIPHVILHCLAQEPAYNPYYALVAGKQCTKHSTMKTFQFRLWDYFATNPSSDPQLAMHYGRFYAQLVHAGIMKLDILKTVDFLGGSADVKIFLEVFFVSLYKQIAKDAEKTAKRSKDSKLVPKSGIDRDGKELALQLSKITDPRVLAGIKFVNEEIAGSDAIQTEKDRARVVWAAMFTNDIIDELVRKLDK